MPDEYSQRIIDIQNLNACNLDPLLQEQTRDWARELDWDFSKSAAVLRQLAQERRLNGAALLINNQLAGYGYAGLEGHKGIIADVYVQPAWRSGDAPIALFRLLLNALIAVPTVQRIESNLLLSEPAWEKALATEDHLRVFERLLMKLDANQALARTGKSVPENFRILPWSDEALDTAASAFWLAHIGHIDSQFNDHYRTIEGVRTYLNSIVQFRGSATFCQPASYIALDDGGRGVGMSLASLIAENVGHISEICVIPQARGAGLGYELLRQSIASLQGAGARRVSLTVTASNEEAIKLYVRCGFSEARRFYACAWDRPAAPPEKL